MHEYDNDLSSDFFEALAETDNFALFEEDVIRELIDCKWPLVLKYIVLKLFIPFIVFLSVYLTYTNQIYLNRDNRPILNLVYIGILTFLSLVLLANELYQFLKQGAAEYFGSIWNYLDFGPPIILLIFMALELLGLFDDPTNKWSGLEASLSATISLGMWLKLLYFLRIFKETGYLIRIIVQVISDMRYFLLILLLTFVAFGDSIYSINSSNSEDDYFAGNSWWSSIFYVYRMVLGDITIGDGVGQVATFYVYLLFILCTVFNMIIMMNLLIAIISESFAKINAISAQTSRQEQAAMIAENTRLIPLKAQREFCRKNEYLVIASDAEDVVETQLSLTDLHLLLKKEITAQFEEFSTKINSQVEKNQQILQEVLSKLQQK